MLSVGVRKFRKNLYFFDIFFYIRDESTETDPTSEKCITNDFNVKIQYNLQKIVSVLSRYVQHQLSYSTQYL